MMKIEAGQTWITRSGKQVQIDNFVSSDPHPVKSGDELSWQENGRFWDDQFDHRNDLVREINNQ